MDRFAHAAANVALGRPATSTAIEVSLGGLAVTCVEGAVTVAVCGGAFAVDHGSERCSPWTVRTLREGDEFSISVGPWGSWCYLAVVGELVAPTWLGSTSTLVRSGLGGGVVGTGDELVIDHALVDDALVGPIAAPPSSTPPNELRIVLGPQSECFVAGAADALLSGDYRLTSAYDRMGVRLDGPPLPLDDVLAIPSTPIVRGSLQVAGDGVPTLLLADHQTTGGYPKIATVLADDTTRATQLRAGDNVRFVALDPSDAVLAARSAAADRRRRLDAIADRPGVRTRHLLTTNLIGGVFHPPDER
jgi:allophanate hydrolase